MPRTLTPGHFFVSLVINRPQVPSIRDRRRREMQALQTAGYLNRMDPIATEAEAEALAAEIRATFGFAVYVGRTADIHT